MEYSFEIEKARIYVNKCAKTLAEIQKETGADVLINGGLFDMKHKDRPNLWLRVDGKTLNTDSDGYWCYGWDVSDFRMIHSNDIETVQNAICCCSLVKDEKATLLFYDEEQGGIRGRSAIGTLPDGRIIIYCSKDGTNGAMKPERLQQYCLVNGWKDAIMLDSGGSSQCITPEGKITSTRKVHNVLCFWLKKESDNQTEEVTTMAKKTLGQAGLNLIKSFEGCRLTAYKPVETEKYWTIGWGHYGSDVKEDMIITQARADELLLQDVAYSVAAVNNPEYCPITASLNQNQFDALVSFCFNCGAGNLKTLCAGRTAARIASMIPAYNKAGGKVLNGLVRRRAAEQALFNKAVDPDEVEPSNVEEVQIWLNRKFHSGLTLDGLYGSNTKKALVKALQQTLGVTADGIYGAKTNAAVKTLKKGSKGTLVKILQCFLICRKQKITADGTFGDATEVALKAVQSHYKIDNDGIAGKMTFQALCR
jgi:GH24 family phage-related lysozyme (muramidase)